MNYQKMISHHQYSLTNPNINVYSNWSQTQDDKAADAMCMSILIRNYINSIDYINRILLLNELV